MVAQSRSPIMSHDLLRAVFRHMASAGAVLLLVVAAAVVYSVASPNVYRSEGKLLVRLGRENTKLDPTVTLGQGEQMLSIPQSREMEINSLVEIIGSRALLEKVVDSIGPSAILPPRTDGSQGDTEPNWKDRLAIPARLEACKQWVRSYLDLAPASDRDRAIDKLAKGLSIAPAQKSSVLRVSCEGQSPQLAQAVVAKVIEVFLEEHLRLNRPAGAQEFLDEQTARLGRNLDTSEEQLRRLKEQTGLVWPEGQRQTLVSHAGRLEEDLQRTSAELAATESALARLKQQLAKLPETEVAAKTAGVGNQGADLMRDRLYALQVQEEETRAKYTEAHPKVQELRQQIASARGILGQEERTRTQVTIAPSKGFEQVHLAMLSQEVALSTLRAKAGTLTTQLAQARGELKTFNDQQVRLAKLQRQQEIEEAKYRRCAAVQEEARLDRALEAQRMTNISIVQPASCEVRPVRPNRLMSLLAGLAGGICAALALALVLEYHDRSFLTPEDIEKQLRLPALADIPQMSHRHLAGTGRR